MNRPDFQTLEALPGHPEMRMVNGSWMDREEYDVCQWFVVREYQTDTGEKGRYWMARLDGLQRYGQLLQERKHQRRVAYQTRMAEDDAWSSHVASLIEARDGE